jgi:hypothetical protein
VAVVGAAALAWPAVSAAGSGAVSGAASGGGSGTLTVSSSPTTAVGSQPVTLTFIFTAAAAPPPDIIVILSMAPGWTVAAPSSTDLTCLNSGCALDGATSTEIEVVLTSGAGSFELVIPATPPGSAGPASFTAAERVHVNPPVILPTVTSSPLNVICPTADLGTVAVDPTTVAVASRGTFTFIYTAGSCGANPSGSVGVTVPNGWTPSGQVATPADNLAPGTSVTFTYGPAQADSAGPATFVAWQAAAGGPMQDLSSAPVVVVTPTAPPSTSTSSTSAPPSTSTPPSTSATASPTGGTRTATVTPSHTGLGNAKGQPVALVAAAGLVLLAGTAGLLTARSRRRRGRLRRVEHGTAGGNVRAVPHAGPPPTVGVRDTGNRPALTVRIEPHASGTATSIKEERP